MDGKKVKSTTLYNFDMAFLMPNLQGFLRAGYDVTIIPPPAVDRWRWNKGQEEPVR